MSLVVYGGEVMFRRALAVVAALGLLLAVGASFASPSPALAQTAIDCPASSAYYADGVAFGNTKALWSIPASGASFLDIEFSIDVNVYYNSQIVGLSAGDSFSIGPNTTLDFVGQRATGSGAFTMYCTSTAPYTPTPTASPTRTATPTATGVPSTSTPFRNFLPYVVRGSSFSNSAANNADTRPNGYTR